MTIADGKPGKRYTAETLLKRGNMYVHLSPMKFGVRVPKYLRKRHQLTLCIGLNTPRPITDLVVDDAGVRATLSFDDGFHFCDVPWSSVYAMVGDDGRGMVWEDCMPAEVVAEVAAECAAVTVVEPTKPARAGLRLVK